MTITKSNFISILYSLSFNIFFFLDLLTIEKSSFSGIHKKLEGKTGLGVGLAFNSIIDYLVKKYVPR